MGSILAVTVVCSFYLVLSFTEPVHAGEKYTVVNKPSKFKFQKVTQGAVTKSNIEEILLLFLGIVPKKGEIGSASISDSGVEVFLFLGTHRYVDINDETYLVNEISKINCALSFFSKFRYSDNAYYSDSMFTEDGQLHYRAAHEEEAGIKIDKMLYNNKTMKLKFHSFVGPPSYSDEIRDKYTAILKKNKAGKFELKKIRYGWDRDKSKASKKKVKPSKPKIIGHKATKTSITLSWKKSKNSTGYQIQYSTGKKFKKAKSKTVKSGSKVKMKIKGLKKGKSYYFRIRAYNKVSGKKFYSKWSARYKATPRA